MVRDNRNPVITCIVEPRSGHELDDADTAGADQPRHSVLVVGAARPEWKLPACWRCAATSCAWRSAGRRWAACWPQPRWYMDGSG